VGIFWRVAVIAAITGLISGAAHAASGVYAAVTPWSPEVLFVTLIPYAVMLGSLVVTVRAYGWAMSTMVAKRLNAESLAIALRVAEAPPSPHGLLAAAAAASRSLAPAAAGARLQCPRAPRDRARPRHRLALRRLRLARAPLTGTGGAACLVRRGLGRSKA
jgi:hypothetical protein